MKLRNCSSRVLTYSSRFRTIGPQQHSVSYQLIRHVKPRHFTTSGTLLHDTKQERAASGHLVSRNQAGAFSSRNCLVTGGASGIGYEVTKQLALRGVQHITITSRDATKVKRAIDKIKTEIDSPNAPIYFIERDFDQPVPTDTLKVNSDSRKQQPFNTLINCAGISQSQGLISTPSDKISMILRTNLEAPIELSRQLLKEYYGYGKRISSSTNSGAESDTNTTDSISSFCIINISSLLALRGGHGTSIYSTSKAGLIAFTRTLTLEAAAIRTRYPSLPPFRANVVVPGYIDTPMIDAFSASHKAKLEGEIPLGRYGTAGEVADAVMFLLGNEYANNTLLNLDGGLSAV